MTALYSYLIRHIDSNNIGMIIKLINHALQSKINLSKIREEAL